MSGYKNRSENKRTAGQTTQGGRIDRRLPAEITDQGMSAEAGRQQEQPTEKKRRANKQKQEPNRPGSKRGRIFRRAALILGALLLVVAVSLGIYVKYSTRNDDLWLDLSQIPYKSATVLYYTDPVSGEVGEYARLSSTQNKEYAPPEQIPQMLRDAFVAVEDKGFYDHKGVDLKRTLYAGLNEVKRMLTGSYIGGESGRKQGASTITQQLVKNLTRDDQDESLAGYLRKVKEIYRAYRLDGRYTKQEILDAYLNSISFTGNTAGVQAESVKLFGKDVSELTVAECASLAAITRNPARYNPLKNPETHLQRRDYVLGLMLRQSYITQQQYDDAIQEPLHLNGTGEDRKDHPVTSYFTDALMEQAISELVSQRGITRGQASDLLYNGGLRIYTTVVPDLQNQMEKVMETAYLYPRPSHTVQVAARQEDGTPLLDENGKQAYEEQKVLPQAAMVSLGYDGNVAAVVGGLGEKEISRGFNRATSAVRQVGSTMKAIGPYAVALEKNKINWSTPFLDAPVTRVKNEDTGVEEDWPANVNRVYSEKDILVREAFARSVNTVAVRVGETVGNGAMYRFTHDTLGIATLTRKDIAPGPLVLGSSTYGITPLDMAKSYAIFGNGGQVPEVHYFTVMAFGNEKVLLEKHTKPKQAIGADTAFIMNRLMKEVLKKGGTAAGMSVPGEMDSVGKTGTTSDNRDHWFIGLTPYYVTASWYGFDDNTPLLVDNRQHPPTLAWREVMRQGQAGLPYKEFPAEETVVTAEYCLVSGSLAGENCPKATGYYKEGHLPEENCPVHG